MPLPVEVISTVTMTSHGYLRFSNLEKFLLSPNFIWAAVNPTAFPDCAGKGVATNTEQVSILGRVLNLT